MNLFKKIKNISIDKIRNLFGKFGIEIQKTKSLDYEIHKLQSITNSEAKLFAAEELVNMYPKHPKPHLELAICLHDLDDIRQYEQMKRHGKVLREWLIQTGLDALDMEFIKQATVVGSLGNHFCIQILIRANQCGLRPAKKTFLLLPPKSELRNPALFSYFEPYLHVIRDEESIQTLRKLETLITLPLGVGIPINDGFPFLDIAANLCEIELEKQGLKTALFCLSDKHRNMGEKVLKKLGLPKDAWYVTLHVREPSYRAETPGNTTENWRNANPLDYLKACEIITRAGGWVFRMGDSSMTPLPPMPQVIDYALNDIRSDWMDVFLGATCRFLIGTGSGYYIIPAFFGVPVMFTNFPGFIQYYGLKSHDLYLPRWLKNNQTNKLISFKEYMSPPAGNYNSIKHFHNAGLTWIENTPEELVVATEEMLERTDDGFSSTIQDTDLQSCFKILAETSGLKYGVPAVKAFAPISRDFLERHADLL